jgi:hypothetical protein
MCGRKLVREELGPPPPDNPPPFGIRPALRPAKPSWGSNPQPHCSTTDSRGNDDTREHGRTRYTCGCRCGVCKAAERNYQRERYRRQLGLPVAPQDPPKLNAVESGPIPSYGGSVVAAVRDRLDGAPAAVERPGLAAAAMVAILDDSKHVATQPAAARQLVAILGTLPKRLQRRGKLAVVKSMTTSAQLLTLDSSVTCPTRRWKRNRFRGCSSRIVNNPVWRVTAHLIRSRRSSSSASATPRTTMDRAVRRRASTAPQESAPATLCSDSRETGGLCWNRCRETSHSTENPARRGLCSRYSQPWSG